MVSVHEAPLLTHPLLGNEPGTLLERPRDSSKRGRKKGARLLLPPGTERGTSGNGGGFVAGAKKMQFRQELVSFSHWALLARWTGTKRACVTLPEDLQRQAEGLQQPQWRNSPVAARHLLFSSGGYKLGTECSKLYCRRAAEQHCRLIQNRQGNSGNAAFDWQS